MSMIAFTRKILKVMVIPVFIFRKVGRSVMAVEFFISLTGKLYLLFFVLLLGSKYIDFRFLLTLFAKGNGIYNLGIKLILNKPILQCYKYNEPLSIMVYSLNLKY